jgi:hypothetical protein
MRKFGEAQTLSKTIRTQSRKNSLIEVDGLKDWQTVPSVKAKTQNAMATGTMAQANPRAHKLRSPTTSLTLKIESH